MYFWQENQFDLWIYSVRLVWNPLARIYTRRPRWRRAGRVTHRRSRRRDHRRADDRWLNDRRLDNRRLNYARCSVRPAGSLAIGHNPASLNRLLRRDLIG